MAENLLTVKTINEIIGEYFFIPAYQRGYRWTDLQVTELLDDIFEFKASNKSNFYCLQPIVVIPKDNKWEVIDGQQRLTTIFIILSYLGEDKFDIDFETRKESSKKFLEELGSINDHDNIDYFYISKAFDVVKTWFEDKKKQIPTIKPKMYIRLGEEVQVIWYEIHEEDADPVDIFTRLNIGKIPLTNAELIKALFLNDDNFGSDSEEVIKLEKIQIANEWDRIEQELHDNQFWAFLNKEYSSVDNRIDYIFNFFYQLENKKIPKEYDVFHYFVKKITSGKDSSITKLDVKLLWAKIKKCYQRLKEWYNNREIYHLLGYSITTGHGQLVNIYNKSFEMRKSEFVDYLKKQIKDRLPDDLDSLNYQDNYAEIYQLLLFFNIITILRSKADVETFSFYRFKDEKWSLEHIHAQNSEGLINSNQRIDWLKDHKEGLDRLKITQDSSIVEEIIQEIDSINFETIAKDVELFNPLFDRIVRVFQELQKDIDIDELGNMALLDKNSNSALNNSVFEVKRKIILERDAFGYYILPGTKNVFLKYYSKSPDHFSFWTETDRNDYVNQMKISFNEYFTDQLYEVAL